MTNYAAMIILNNFFVTDLDFTFLAQAAMEFPDTIRFILTGFSDYDAIVNAINNGKIQGYFHKPLTCESLLKPPI